MILGRPSAVHSVDVSRAVGLFKQSGGPLPTYGLSLFPWSSLLQVAVVDQPGPERGPHHLGLRQELALARGLETAHEVGVEVVTPQDLVSHGTIVTYI